jgi:hypothetical protein
MDFEINMHREFLLAGDVSASMNQNDPRCDGLTRYKYMLEKFKSFITIAEDYDTHQEGVTVMLFGAKVEVFEHTTLKNIESKLNNIEFEGLTMTDLLLDEAFKEHREEKSELAKEGKVHPGTCLMIFTDGVPTNMAATERAVLNIANAIDREEEFDIVFLTVGTMDRSTIHFLDKLKANVKKAKYNIVSVRSLEETTFLAAATES